MRNKKRMALNDYSFILFIGKELSIARSKSLLSLYIVIKSSFIGEESRNEYIGCGFGWS